MECYTVPSVRDHRFLDAAMLGRSVSPSRFVLFNLAVSAAYLASGYAGLKLAFVGQVVTLFWPPSGFAFAAVWLGGLRLLPGVWVGAFATNLIVSDNWHLAAEVACGSLGAPFAANVALRTWLSRHSSTGEFGHVVLFVLVALGSTMISATIGTWALAANDNLDRSVPLTWLVWWLGDAMGILIVAPPILLWQSLKNVRLCRNAFLEIGLLTVATTAILLIPLFADEPIWASELGKLSTFLLSLWAGARFGLNGPAWMMLLIAAGTISTTLLNTGPFQRGDFYDNFTLVHSHLFSVSLAGLLLAATFADLRRTIGLEIEARETAEEAAVGRVRLLQTISHDVRTPLSGILTVLQTLERDSISPEQGRLIGLGLRAGRTLTTLVTDILEAARADAGRITLVLAPFSPAASLADIADLCGPAAADKGLLIQLSCSSQVPALVSGDRVRFEQIMSNLVVNAVAYTPRGRISIDVGWDELSGGALVVEVADTGPGIDPTRVLRMFDAFASNHQQAGNSVGLGLGLHICRRLTELMGGALQYSPEPAGGSRFRVTLPLLVSVQGPTATISHADPALRILLVEDDEIAGETTCALLRSHGHDAVLVANAGAALAHAASEFFELVLLDLQLGLYGDSGFDVVRSIRKLPGAIAMVRVIALTGDNIAESRATLKEAGFDGVVAKPLMIGSGMAAMIKAATWETIYATDIVGR